MREFVVLFTVLSASIQPFQARAQEDSARAILRKAATAMGGESLLRGLSTIHRQFRVDVSDPTQGARPLARGKTEPAVYLRDRWTLDIDYRTGRERLFTDATIYGNQPTRALSVSRPDSVLFINYTLRTGQAFASGPNRAPIGRFTPEGLLRRALDRPEAVQWLGTKRVGGREVAVVGFKEAGASRAQRLVFDRGSGQLVRHEADGDDPVLGDLLTTLEFSDPRPTAAGLTLPTKIVQRRNGVRYRTWVVTEQTIGATLDDSIFTVPAGYHRDNPPPPSLTAEPIGQDVYLLRAAYNSLFVVAEDHVVVIEAPVDSRRSMQVLAEVRRIAPGKPIRAVISTHFHSDHIGGLRPFIAAGVPILTTATARQAIVDYLVKGTRTISPDTLSVAPRPPIIEVVKGRRTLGDRAHPIEIVDLSPNPHADEILAVWLPEERLLFEGDMLDLLVPEGAPSMPGDDTRALAAAIAKAKLPVERIVPVHGRPGTLADLDRTVARRDR